MVTQHPNSVSNIATSPTWVAVLLMVLPYKGFDVRLRTTAEKQALICTQWLGDCTTTVTR